MSKLSKSQKLQKFSEFISLEEDQKDAPAIAAWLEEIGYTEYMHPLSKSEIEAIAYRWECHRSGSPSPRMID